MTRAGYKAVGAAMIILGVVFAAMGYFDGSSALRTSGPALAFFGIVLLVQAKRRG